MINEIARMRFESARNPSEKGSLVITEDGFFQVEPSEEFIETLAGLEETAVAGARRVGLIASGVLVGLACLAAALAWFAGRMGGEMRETLTFPRPVEDVEIKADAKGNVRVILPGTGPQTVVLEWEAGETNADEASLFAAVFDELKSRAQGE